MITIFKIYEKNNYNKLYEREDIINFIKTNMNKYNLDFLILNIDVSIYYDYDYYLNSIEKRGNDIYLVYEEYNINLDKYIQKNFYELPDIFILKVYNIIKANNLFKPSNLLEMIDGKIKYFHSFIEILKNTKGKIDFNTAIFSSFDTIEGIDMLNSIEFQEILFKYHPEAIDSFLNANFEVHKEIRKKYPKIDKEVEKYNIKKNMQKYNV